MYGRSRIILKLLIGAFILSLAASSTLIITDLVLVGCKSSNISSNKYTTKYTIHQYKDALDPLLSGVLCTAARSWNLSYSYIIPILLSESLLFGLALLKGYHHMSDDSLGAFKRSSLLSLLVKDSILYFSA